jgi:4-hydroxy-tetrahydrodipicolinate synthase
MAHTRKLAGVIPAALTPLDEHGEIHEPDLRRHLEYLLSIRGVTGITVNGHAGEIASLSLDEQRRVLAMARELTPASKWLIAGVYAQSTAQACELAALAAAEGADALLIFPPEPWQFGLQEDPRLAYRYYAAISQAAALPIVAFVYPTTSAFHMGPEVVMQLCSEVPAITAIKDWSNDILVYEENLRRLRSEHPAVSMLSSFSRSLPTSLALGADGILSGHGSLIPEIHVDLFDSFAAGDLHRARVIARTLYDLTRVYYAGPISDGFTRMKAASVMLGRIGCAAVREPLLPLSDAAIRQVQHTVPMIQQYLSERAAPTLIEAGR